MLFLKLIDLRSTWGLNIQVVTEQLLQLCTWGLGVQDWPGGGSVQFSSSRVPASLDNQAHSSVTTLIDQWPFGSFDDYWSGSNGTFPGKSADLLSSSLKCSFHFKSRTCITSLDFILTPFCFSAGVTRKIIFFSFLCFFFSFFVCVCVLFRRLSFNIKMSKEKIRIMKHSQTILFFKNPPTSSHMCAWIELHSRPSISKMHRNIHIKVPLIQSVALETRYHGRGFTLWEHFFSSIFTHLVKICSVCTS